jgi:hypothetical protein
VPFSVSALARQRHAIEKGKHDSLDAPVGRQEVIERADGHRFDVIVVRIDDEAVPERVVENEAPDGIRGRIAS